MLNVKIFLITYLKVDVDKDGNKKLDVNIPEGKECWGYSNFTFKDMNKK